MHGEIDKRENNYNENPLYGRENGGEYIVRGTRTY